MTVCGEKVTGVCSMGKCPHIKRCCPVVWDKYGKIKPQTNFDNVAKDADTLAKWLSDKIHFCREVPCDECKINCANDDVNVTNADLWSAWLKQPHTTIKE